MRQAASGAPDWSRTLSVTERPLIQIADDSPGFRPVTAAGQTVELADDLFAVLRRGLGEGDPVALQQWVVTQHPQRDGGADLQVAPAQMQAEYLVSLQIDQAAAGILTQRGAVVLQQLHFLEAQHA